MASYNYICNSCSDDKDHDKWLVFEANHGMNEKPKIKCPNCGKTDTEKCFSGYDPPAFYTRGYGWLDIKGRRRDMNLWKLQNEDPYGHMRAPGEKAEMEVQLKKGGRHNPKGNNFYVSKKTAK